MASPQPVRNLRPRASVYLAGALYVAIVAITIHYHEPWADEAQAWLLARDASLFELCTRLLHYEGTPGLWHTILHLLIRVGMPYAGLNVVSATLGTAAAGLLLWRVPLPVVFRLLLPFTYFICYQYGVIARSYSLLPALTVGCAILFKGPLTKIIPLTALLCLMAAVSVHGFAFSVAIWFAFHLSLLRRWKAVDARERQRYITAALSYAVALSLLALSALPARDVAFPFEINLTLSRFWVIGGFLLREAFAGAWPVSLAAIALSLPFLWKGDALLVFLSSITLLWAVSSIVYLQYWHVGIVFLAWLFALSVASHKVRMDFAACAALTVIISVQCYWTARSVAYDVHQPYSGSLHTAEYLKGLQPSKTRIYCAGYSCTAIQPYFARNVFANLNQGREAAYWDWSSRNKGQNPETFFTGENPEYIVIGYKTPAEAVPWATLMTAKGYRKAKGFDGHLFWKTHELEPESFDVYRHHAEALGPTASSVVNLADPNAAWQLRRGFYGLESNAWRWTSREFSVVLMAPQGEDLLELLLVIPETQIQKLGPMTLSAEIDGHPLEPQVFSQPGSYTYSRKIPPATDRSRPVTVKFHLDKASSPSAADSRELGVIATAVGIYPPHR